MSCAFTVPAGVSMAIGPEGPSPSLTNGTRAKPAPSGPRPPLPESGRSADRKPPAVWSTRRLNRWAAAIAPRRTSRTPVTARADDSPGPGRRSHAPARATVPSRKKKRAFMGLLLVRVSPAIRVTGPLNLRLPGLGAGIRITHAGSLRRAPPRAEPAGVLTGHVRINYANHSPDTLRDFYVHQYLNAFRPGSRWAAADSSEGRDRFQHLTDPDYAFERITGASVQGTTQQPDYPLAPDSTVAHWTLPRPLAPGDSLVVEVDWQARPSTLPRRQGRQGRRFDFAQWYPKVVVYDRFGWEAHPLYPAGEFYGEFATYDVTLDVPADEVIGATGVPVAGDPGWEHAKADPALRIDYQRDWYGPPPRAGGLGGLG